MTKYQLEDKKSQESLLMLVSVSVWISSGGSTEFRTRIESELPTVIGGF